MLAAIAAKNNLEIKQYNTVNAFTHTKLKDLVAIRMPKGYKTLKYIILIKKALYRLRKSPLL